MISIDAIDYTLLYSCSYIKKERKQEICEFERNKLLWMNTQILILNLQEYCFKRNFPTFCFNMIHIWFNISLMRTQFLFSSWNLHFFVFQNAQMFYQWLKAAGIRSHLDSIVEAIAEKVSHGIIYSNNFPWKMRTKRKF